MGFIVSSSFRVGMVVEMGFIVSSSFRIGRGGGYGIYSLI